MTAYGLTNAAKHRIFDWVSREARGRPSLRVFDYGCGTGSDWPEILRSHPSIVFFGYEPDVNAATRAQGRMAGLSASILSETELQSAELEADVIVSLSVFEHVVDRVGYLATARANLAPDGTFFLNYDDGHFRNDLRLESPRKWRQPLRAFGRHLVSPVLARMGRDRSYTVSVVFADLPRMVQAAGFVVEDDRLENLPDFKILVKEVPEAERAAFARRWVETEDALNRDLGHVTDPSGIPVLWRRMLTRTLTLRHAANP